MKGLEVLGWLLVLTFSLFILLVPFGMLVLTIGV